MVLAALSMKITHFGCCSSLVLVGQVVRLIWMYVSVLKYGFIWTLSSDWFFSLLCLICLLFSLVVVFPLIVRLSSFYLDQFGLV